MHRYMLIYLREGEGIFNVLAQLLAANIMPKEPIKKEGNTLNMSQKCWTIRNKYVLH
jgi:hypothetical protein